VATVELDLADELSALSSARAFSIRGISGVGEKPSSAGERMPGLSTGPPVREPCSRAAPIAVKKLTFGGLGIGRVAL
jgi:hypothetical protein